MPDSYKAEIRSLAIFEHMADANFEAIMRGAYVQNFPPQVDLITEGDTADFMHVVISGSVELFATWNGRETTMSVVRPISTFILAATIKDAHYLMSARTLEKSRVIMLPSSDVRRVFDEDHKFARAVVTELAQCYRAVVKNSKELKLRTSLERLANHLLRQQARTNGAANFELTIEKRKLASQLGMTPENLSRAIKALRPYGVTIQGTTVQIAKQDDLVQLAKPTPLIDDPAF